MSLVHTRFEIFETFVRFIRTIFSQVNYNGGTEDCKLYKRFLENRESSTYFRIELMPGVLYYFILFSQIIAL